MASDGSQAFQVPAIETNALGYLPGMRSMQERRADPYIWHSGAEAEAAAGARGGNTGTWYGPAPTGSQRFRERAARTERETAASVGPAGVVGAAGARAAPRAQARDVAVRGADFRLPLAGFRDDPGRCPPGLLAYCDAPEFGGAARAGGDVIAAAAVDSPAALEGVLAAARAPRAIFVSVHVGEGTAAADADGIAAAFAAVARSVPASAVLGVDVRGDADRADPEALHALLARLIDGAGGAPAPRVLCMPISPLRPQRKIVGMCMRRGLNVIASEPLGRDGSAAAALAGEPVVEQLCLRYGRSVEGVLLRWCVQRGVACLVPGACGARAAEELFEWELHPQDKALIDALGK